MRRWEHMNQTEAAGWNKVCNKQNLQHLGFQKSAFQNVPVSGPLCCAANVRRSWFVSRDATTQNAERNLPNQKTLSKRQLTVQLQIFPEHFWTGCSLKMQKGDHGFFFFFFEIEEGGWREQTASGSSTPNSHSSPLRRSWWDLLAASSSYQHSPLEAVFLQVLSSVLNQTCSVSHSNLHVCPLKGDCVGKKKRKEQSKSLKIINNSETSRQRQVSQRSSNIPS